MKKLNLAFFLFFLGCVSAQSAEVSPTAAVPRMNCGNVQVTIPSSWKLYVAYAAGNASSGLRLPGSSTDYQVTAAKTFYVQCVIAYSEVTGMSSLAIGYADNTPGYQNGAYVPTNPVYLSGGTTSANSAFSIPAWSTGSAISGAFSIYYGGKATIPANKYPFVKAGASQGGFYHIWGYEL